MAADDEGGKKLTVAENDVPESSLFQRSSVTPNLPYKQYKETLRDDFYWSCAYCTITEFEAEGIRMAIDHYEPQTARRDLANAYDNLMYSCDDCNSLKGDRCPPEPARADGRRFFRPDQDYRHEHFKEGVDQSAGDLEGITNTGNFTIEFIDLNRPPLQRLRKIRRNMYNCHAHVLHGILGLKHFPIDRLPPNMRSRALQRIRQWEDMMEEHANELDAVLRGIAYSPMLGRDPEREARAEKRAAEQKRLEGLYPGQSWRTRRQPKKR
jgi:hypothetical protein